MKIKELLTEPSKWTQHMYACDKSGNSTSEKDENATAWCLAGAMYKCYTDLSQCRKVSEIIKNKIGYYIADWNDSPKRTFDDVKKLVEELDI